MSLMYYYINYVLSEIIPVKYSSRKICIFVAVNVCLVVQKFKFMMAPIVLDVDNCGI